MDDPVSKCCNNDLQSLAYQTRLNMLLLENFKNGGKIMSNSELQEEVRKQIPELW